MALRTLIRNNVSCHYERVKKVMQFFKQEVNEKPTIPSNETRILRARLMLEEPLETIQDGLGVDIVLTGIDPEEVRANYGTVTIPSKAIKDGKMLFKIARPFDMIETVDGCFDTIVVTTGTLISCGVPDMDGQALVDEANIAKCEGGHVDEFGKFQKPAGWKPADIGGLITALTVEAEQFPKDQVTATLGLHDEESE